jgi:S-adenosylmethionine-diacylglycerol 3-amino-3-carboxypropyl transferase
MHNRINYSQCWEDLEVLTEALMVAKDDTVLSVTSGGDNTLALVGEGPARIVSIDVNPAQNYMLELKLAAAQQLGYAEYRGFLGADPSDSRMGIYAQLSKSLSPDAAAWWSRNGSAVAAGVIHSGRFERYTAFFARRVMPLVHSKVRISELLSCEDLDAQRQFYVREWNTRSWRFFFNIAASRLMLGRARQHTLFAHVRVRDIGAIYMDRLEKHLMSRTAKGNYFLEYSLMGTYVSKVPRYLSEICHSRIRTYDAQNLEIVASDLLSYLRSAPAESFSKYNLSDVFEAFDDAQYEALWKEIVRTARPGARIAYWTNLMPRAVPKTFEPCVLDEVERAAALAAKDKVFFYGSFKLYTVLP